MSMTPDEILEKWQDYKGNVPFSLRIKDGRVINWLAKKMEETQWSLNKVINTLILQQVKNENLKKQCDLRYDGVLTEDTC